MCRLENRPCWICGMEIDYRISDPHDPEVFELDHMYPVKTHPEFAEDPAGFRASHRMCNNRRGIKMLQPRLNETSRSWLK